MTQAKTPQQKSGWNLLPLLVGNKSLLKTLLASSLAKELAAEYKTNASHYKDMLRFNFRNGIESDKVYDTVSFSDPPPNERGRLRKMYKLFKECELEEIFEELGTKPNRCKYAPIEAKWAYTYFKKYGTWEYDPDNEVSDEEILKKLTTAQRKQYLSMF